MKLIDKTKLLTIFIAIAMFSCSPVFDNPYDGFVIGGPGPVISGDTPTNDTTPAWTWAPPFGAFKYRYGFTDNVWLVDETPNIGFTPQAPLEDGDYTLYVQAGDADGNWTASSSYTITVDTTNPSVISTSPADNTSNILLDTSISVTFSKSMDASTVTTNTADTLCSGSFQVSSDNFTSCERMSEDPVASDNNKTFTINPAGNLDRRITYKIRITTSVQDDAGNALASIYLHSTGFSGSLPGTLDITFNGTGFVTDNGADKSGKEIALDSAGNIFVTGESFNGSNYDMTIWKYDSSGSPDTAFGTGGIVVHNDAAGGNGDDWGKAIALDSAGNILVTGYSLNIDGNYDMIIWKYDSGGSPITAFGAGSIVVHNNAAGGNGHDIGKGIALDSADNILVAGESRSNGSSSDMVIWKYDSSGSLDSTFGAGGIVVHNSAAGGNGRDAGNGIVLDSAGNILVTGNSINTDSNYDMIIWKYDSSGSPVTTFGTGGTVVHNSAAGGNGHDIGEDIALDSADNILVTGNSYNTNNNRDMVIWMYDSNGSLDTAFGDSGIAVHDSAAGGDGDDYGTDIALDSIGNILTIGRSFNGSNYDMVIWRYLN